MRSLRTLSASFAVLAALLASHRVYAQDQKAPTAKRIVIGEGVAGVKLGMTADEVVAILGEPERKNGEGAGLVFMSYSDKEIFGIYFGGSPPRVRMIILTLPEFCTLRGVCLRKAGELKRLQSTYPGRVVRFKDWDGEVTYRLLNNAPGGASGGGKEKILTEFSAAQDGSLQQVMMLYWTGAITDSALDGDGPRPKGKAKGAP